MKTFFYTLFFMAITSIATAQQAPIMVCNPAGTTCAPYTDLTNAYNAANAGDYIYIPGGNFSLSVNIAKEIHFVGAGFHSTASATTGTTNISGNITLDTGCNNSSFEGFYLAGDFTTTNSLSNISFRYLRANKITLTSNLTSPNIGLEKYNNCLVANCVINDEVRMGTHSPSIANPNLGNNNIISNSFIGGGVINLNNSTVKNSIIGYHQWCYYHNIVGCRNTVVKNNYFYAFGNGIVEYGCGLGSVNITFINNALHLGTATAYGGSNIIESGNQMNQSFANTFVNATTISYSETQDFHIKTTSPAHNGGDDGTDMGIYGGAFPWKEGAMPSNPHIFFKNISNATDANGNLPVQIKVSAQN